MEHLVKPPRERTVDELDGDPSRWGAQLASWLDTDQYVAFGQGCLGELPRILEERRIGRPLFVSSARSARSQRLNERLVGLAAGLRSARFHEFTPNPEVVAVQEGVEVFRQSGCDAVVGVGGGSAMDVAKSIAALATQPHDAARYVVRARRLDAPRRAPVVLVPTTAGTGSEVTCFAALYSDGIKYSLDDPCLRADVALVDPALADGMAPELTASTGLDALAQAMESYWSVRSTLQSRRVAARAIRIALRFLVHAVHRRSPFAIAAMSLGAVLAGHAINLTRTTACHAISYALSLRLGMAHGHACAMTLPEFLLFNGAVDETDLQDVRGVSFVRERMFDVASMILGQVDLDETNARTLERAYTALVALVRRTGMSSRLSELGATPEMLDEIAGAYDIQRAANNPRRVTRDSVRKILFEVY